jgi:hypothetical protein
MAMEWLATGNETKLNLIINKFCTLVRQNYVIISPKRQTPIGRQTMSNRSNTTLLRLLHSVDEGTTILRNVENYSPNDTTSHFRTLYSSTILL